MHWFEELLSSILNAKPKKKLVCNAGLSVSGLQHVGRLRGEVVLPNAIANELRASGKDVTQYLVLYTQDPWKGKEAQLKSFKGKEGERYINRRLIDVPDPDGCCENWVEHYWRDFGGYLEHFANDVNVVTTSQLYEREDMRTIVLDIVKKKDKARKIVNKYRGERKYGEDWIPFEPYCTNCQKIGIAKPLEIGGDEVTYECSCGHQGKSPIKLGKLNWRLEWPALWKLLDVDVEPFGKDHATPGGSRDSCAEIADKILDIEAPFGIPYEWVGYSKKGKDLGDMSSSGFRGFTPKDWVEVAEPEILKYIYLRNSQMKRLVLDLAKMDVYYDAFDNATRSYYKSEKDKEEELDAFSWRLTVRERQEPRFILAYRHAALLSQILPKEGELDWAVDRLKDTGMIKGEPSPDEIEGIEIRLACAEKWVESYALEYKVKLLESLTPEIKSRLDDEDKKALQIFAESLSEAEWSEESIKNVMVSLTKSGRLPVDTKRFFKILYLAFLGTERGPRAAPFLSILEKKFVMERLKDVGK